MVHLSNHGNRLAEAIEQANAQQSNAEYIILASVLLLYVGFVTFLIIREYKEIKINRDFSSVFMISGISLLGALMLFLVTLTITEKLFLSEAKENRDKAIQANIEANIDGTVEYLQKYPTDRDDPEWVRGSRNVYTVTIQTEETIYPHDVVMTYHETYDVMIPIDPNDLTDLPIIEGSTLSTAMEENTAASRDTITSSAEKESTP